MTKALRDLPEDELKTKVRDCVQGIVTELLRGASHAHTSGVMLTFKEPEKSAAIGSELDCLATNLANASGMLREATSAWEVLVGRAMDKRAKKPAKKSVR